MQLKILIVDDDTAIRTSLSQYIDASGSYDTVLCVSGEDAINKLEAGFRPDLLIADQRLPGIAGQGLIRYVKDKLPNCYSVLFSANLTRQLTELVLADGANDVLAKPFDIKHLDAILIKAALHRDSQGKTLKQLELEAINQALRTQPTLQDAAKALGINTATLWRKRKQLEE